ncbi:MAG: hypothetical protein ACK5MR_10260 [Cumulibacter sp.]
MSYYGDSPRAKEQHKEINKEIRDLIENENNIERMINNLEIIEKKISDVCNIRHFNPWESHNYSTTVFTRYLNKLKEKVDEMPKCYKQKVLEEIGQVEYHLRFLKRTFERQKPKPIVRKENKNEQ